MVGNHHYSGPWQSMSGLHYCHLSPASERSILILMHGDEQGAEAENDALDVLRFAKVDPDMPVPMLTLARDILQIPISWPYDANCPKESDIVWIEGAWRIRIYHHLKPEREAYCIGHETMHWWYRKLGRVQLPSEEWLCNRGSAALSLPPPAFRRALKHFKYSPRQIAGSFKTTEPMAHLRIGEIDGRPVWWNGKQRGAPFAWGSHPSLLPRSMAHRVSIDGGWGYMAERSYLRALEARADER